nr:MAG TPA_asm: hypothetical protein [Caudoviricetes sp.]
MYRDRHDRNFCSRKNQRSRKAPFLYQEKG